MGNGNSSRSGSTPSPARYGFSDAVRAEEQLRAAGWWSDSGPTEEAVLSALSRAPDPDLALLSLDRLREAAGAEWEPLAKELAADGTVRGGLIGVLGASSAFADHLVAHPEDWRRLRPRPEAHAPDVAALTEQLLVPVGGADPELTGTEAVSALRGAYRGLLLEVAGKTPDRPVVPAAAQQNREPRVNCMIGEKIWQDRWGR